MTGSSVDKKISPIRLAQGILDGQGPTPGDLTNSKRNRRAFLSGGLHGAAIVRSARLQSTEIQCQSEDQNISLGVFADNRSENGHRG